ncbi:MAG: SAM-dependent methyltransferase [Saprospiraceae bacterium]|jgi:SAM-dependent methyltransferase
MDIQNLKEQLRCPKGDLAKHVGDIMNESNKHMIAKCIDKIDFKGNERILEIGQGNGKHVHDLLQNHKSVSYEGIEISAEMYNESIENNTEYIENDRTVFRLYDGLILPYMNDSFDVILTINTIYFWEDAESFLTEIRRVVSPQGSIYITFLHKETTENQTFLDDDFQHYSYDTFLELVDSCGLVLRRYFLKKECAINKIGQYIDRYYGIYQLAT